MQEGADGEADHRSQRRGHSLSLESVGASGAERRTIPKLAGVHVSQYNQLYVEPTPTPYNLGKLLATGSLATGSGEGVDLVIQARLRGA